jgi:Mrp family chromosome partitioning ATPase
MEETAEPSGPGPLGATLRHWKLAGTILAAAIAASLVFTLAQPKRYEATSRVTLMDPSGAVFRQTGVLTIDLERAARRAAAFAESVHVAERASELIGGGVTSSELGRNLSASTLEGGVGIQIKVRAPTAKAAAARASALVTAYQELQEQETRTEADAALAAIAAVRAPVADKVIRLSQTVSDNTGNPALRAQLDSALQELATLDRRADEVNVNARAKGSGVDFVAVAHQPAGPVQPTPIRNLAAGLALGILLAVLAAWTRAITRQSTDTSSLPRDVLDVPRLGRVPRLDGSSDEAALTDVGAMPAESYQFVASALLGRIQSGVVLVTSSRRGEGKTVTTANLAAAAAWGGHRVLVVDTDTESYGLTRLLKYKHTPGFVDLVLANGQRSAGTVTKNVSDTVSLAFIPTGLRDLPNVGSVFRSARTAEVIKELRSQYDLILVDCRDVVDFADVAGLAPHADALLLVVAEGTTHEELASARDLFEVIPTPLVGYVYTGVPGRRAFAPRLGAGSVQAPPGRPNADELTAVAADGAGSLAPPKYPEEVQERRVTGSRANVRVKGAESGWPEDQERLAPSPD